MADRSQTLVQGVQVACLQVPGISSDYRGGDRVTRVSPAVLSLHWCHPVPPAFLPQLVLFGLSNQMVVTFKEENTAAFKHLFLKDYRQGADSALAIYTQRDVYSHINFTIEQVRS